MSNSLKTIAQLAAPKLSEWLLDADKYLAHTRKGYSSEKFEVHVTLVNGYFQALCKVHGLDTVIDRLILAIVKANFSVENQLLIGEVIKGAFVNVIHFHDFGKVNENFQADPKKMNNPFFKIIPNHPLESRHSSLGAYLFILRHIQETSTTIKLPNDEMMKLHLIILLLSYPIFKHHAPTLKEPIAGDIDFKDEFKAMKNYIRLYQFPIDARIADGLPLNMKKAYFDRFDKILKSEFPQFALIKLSFSLLTASDYLATHEYMSDAPTTDFGILDNRERVSEIVGHLRQPTKDKFKHNRKVFANIENFTFERPTEKSNDNLNRLRLEMAVELIQTIRKHTDKRLFYIEAPTGGGKTNLSMIALTELLEKNPAINKVYYVFPFTTLITQTYQALKETLGLTNQELVQLHSKAGFASKQEANEDGVFGDEKKDFIDNLFALYPVTVLSHVKFFDILKTNYKETNYLLHRLANSVVVIDELQSYNPSIWDKMLYFISQYAEYFNIRFVLMSATLPKISELNIGSVDKRAFVDLLPNANWYLQNANFAQRVNFRFDFFEQEISQEELAEKVIEKSEQYAATNREYQSVYTIVEFIYKKTATAFHQLIQGKVHPFDKIFVLSGTILEPRRRQIINYLKNKDNRTQNILLITTQVVEAGVDIDMDLGFKNISLLDSDEQLAGRVNRNASKPNAEVYLFRLDDASMLYKADERYKVTRDTNQISREDYKRILKEKDFKFLYEKVFGKINQQNAQNLADNFKPEILDEIQHLNYDKVDKNFKIIDQQNESVFVPIPLPIYVDSSDPEEPDEPIFSKEDLEFLITLNAFEAGDQVVNGKRVWDAYKSLIENRSHGFDIKEKMRFKLLQSIMSKFTFSLISYSKDLQEMLLGFAEDKYGYIYFSKWNEQRSDGKPYDCESGLNSKAFSDSSFI